jgi:aromatase
MTTYMTDARTVITTHTTFVAAPPQAVYNLIADATRWPFIFSAFVHVDQLAGGPSEDRLRLWAVGNGAVRSWTTRRLLDGDDQRIRFRQEAPAAPVASMTGEWVFVPLPGSGTSVVLLHEFRAIGDDPVNTALIKQAVDRNSTAELAALKRTAELGERLPTLVHSFTDTLTVGAPLEPVYKFLYRAHEWPKQLSHVSRLVLDEAVPNVQTIEMDTGEPDEPQLTTRMVRVCFPYRSIVYKQTHPPQMISAHVGEWRLYPTAEGVRVIARNTVMIRPDGVATGQPGGVQRDAEMVRDALRRSCQATLLGAKDAAETHR